MPLNILSSELDKIRQHAKQGYPHEVVGILAGVRTDNSVSLVHPLINERGATHNRYQVSGLTLMRAEQSLEAQGLEIVGYYHSHPDHPAQYSEYDRDHALPNMSYMIISVQAGEPDEIQSWRLSDNREIMNEETITETIN